MTTPTPLLSMLESYLKLTTAREQAISANMANVDTPGYHTHDINFAGELQNAMRKISNVGNGSESVPLIPASREVHGLLERPDGNNVSLDREGLLMAETQLQYALGIQLIRRQFHQIISAINGGSQS